MNLDSVYCLKGTNTVFTALKKKSLDPASGIAFSVVIKWGRSMAGVLDRPEGSGLNKCFCLNFNVVTLHHWTKQMACSKVGEV